MSQVRTNAAAAILGVSANTLRGWEQRFGHPAPRRTEGGHRIFERSEIEALRDALSETGEIAAAISIVRERGEGPSSAQRLRLAFADFNETKADRLLEESMLTRSLERTVQEVLLPAVELLCDATPERCFAWRYATGWVAAAKRLAPPAVRQEGVMIFDASGQGSLEALHAQALELLLRRAGLRTLSLPAALHPERIGNALRALAPTAIVLAGASADLHAVAKLVFAARQTCGQIAVYDFRDAVPDTGASTVTRLGQSPLAAVEMLRDGLIAPSFAQQACTSGAEQRIVPTLHALATH
jgi:DNA-binding transcriptional MerR regulator